MNDNEGLDRSSQLNKWSNNQAYSAESIVKILILQRRDWALESLRKYRKEVVYGQTRPDREREEFTADLYALFMEVSPMLKRRLKAEEYDELRKKTLSKDTTSLLDAFETINGILDGVGLTRIDTREVYDTTNPEVENDRSTI